MDEREGACACGALEVFELIDGDLGTGRGFDHGGVAEGVAGIGRRGELGTRGERKGKEGGGKEGGGEAVHKYETHEYVYCILVGRNSEREWFDGEEWGRCRWRAGGGRQGV